jgi:hypothetical protein
MESAGMFDQNFGTPCHPDGCVCLRRYLLYGKFWPIILSNYLMLAKLITGEPPFENMELDMYYHQVIMEKTRRSKPKAERTLGGEVISDHLWEMILSCWGHTPQRRFTMRHVLACLDVDPDTIYEPTNEAHFTATAATNCE